ncbi:vacuolar protein sorting-associated protein 52 [[Candida] jaroonii]|uniref:Vacuolar protein sorting-associated protein 52 n=1 Tax=[Candida] jaroonii TaxID=467808 RepID=A0ACA9Y2A6_9ASCO|nr:vacuolar protein sorting-associated protein 52 [[Candida] jaroonii]
MNVLKQILPPIEQPKPKQAGDGFGEDDGSNTVISPSDEKNGSIDSHNSENVEDFENLIQFLHGTYPKDLILEKIRTIPDNSLNLTDGEITYFIDKFSQYQTNLNQYQQRLQPIETVLTTLNDELSKLSESLIDLHAKSTDLSKNLQNHSNVSDKLNPIILDLIIPPDIVQSIMNSPINEDWLENLRFINDKTQLIDSIEDETLDPQLIELYKGSIAFKQLKDGLHVLIAKAIESIRDHMIKQIKLLRSSNSQSSQALQQKLLLVKDIWPFLDKYQPKLASQLQLAYLFTMKWYYTSKFSKYLYALQKLHIRYVDTTMVLNHSEEKAYFALKNWIPSSVASSTSPNPNSNGFPQTKLTFNEYLGSIDKRLEILSQNDHSMPAQIAETTPFGYWIEFIFNQWFQALIDNVMVEYVFVVEFFYQSDEKLHLVEMPKSIDEKEPFKKDWSLVVFEDIYKIGKDFVSWLITHQPLLFNNRTISQSYNRLPTGSAASTTIGSCDAFGVLLMIRMIQTYSNQLHNKFHIPVLEDHINSLYFELWPHFSKIIDLNSESLKKSIIRLTNNNLAPTIITQQYGQYLSGLLKLCNSENITGEPIVNSLSRLRNDFENTITKITNQFKNQSDKEIFLFNNYFLIVNILKNDNDQENDLVQDNINHFQLLCDAYRK